MIQPDENTQIEQLRLGVRAVKALRKIGVKTVGDLIEIEEETLLEQKNVGRLTVLDIRGALNEIGLDLKKRFVTRTSEIKCPYIKDEWVEITQRYIDGETLRQLADSFGVTVSTIRMKIFKTLHRRNQDAWRELTGKHGHVLKNLHAMKKKFGFY